MTLLLAFFIILQAFASVQKEGLFYTGQGSFIRALETFGLGGVWEGMGGPPVPGRSGARYRAPEGDERPPEERRVDPELEEARRAVAIIEDLFEVRKQQEGGGCRVSLPTPFVRREPGEEFTEEEKRFCRLLARRIQPLLLARGFVVRVSTHFHGEDRSDPRQVSRALAWAERVRRELLNAMRPEVRPAAADRLYAFCRREPRPAPRDGTEQLRIDLLLTKPFAKRLEEEVGRDESDQQTL